MSRIRVVLVEDHDLTRVALRTALARREDIDFLGEARNGAEGLALLQNTQADVALVDIDLPELDGVELTRQYKAVVGDSNTATKILILTLQDNENTVMAAFAAGADSYCMKDTQLEWLVKAIKTTHEGNAWIDPAIAQVVLSNVKSPNSPNSPEPEEHTLTERELEVLQLIVDGCSNADIAQRLYITVGTVKTHVRNILNKLCADDRTQAAVQALRSGIIKLDQS